MSEAPTANTIAITRLSEERKQWRKEHPFGFYAKPITNEDGSLNLLIWECGIPGKTGSIWEGGLYRIRVTFSSSYPTTAPKCLFTPPIPHPNIYPSGNICLSLLNDWKPSVTLKQLLLGVQQLLDEPNLKSPANGEIYDLMRHSRAGYERRVREFAARHRP